MNGKIKDLVIYSITIGIAGLSGVAIFYKMLYHIFGGKRGKEAFDNLATSSDYSSRLQGFYQIFDRDIFGNLLLYLLLLILIGLALAFFLNRKQSMMKPLKKHGDFILIVFSCMGYFLVISKVAAFITVRYMMPIFPVVFLIVAVLIIWLSERLKKEKVRYISISGIFLFLLFSSYQTNKIEYLFLEAKDNIKFAKEHSSSLAICVYDGASWKVHPSYVELSKYKNLLFVKEKNLSSMDDAQLQPYREVVVYIFKSKDDNAVLESLKEKNKNLVTVNKLQSFGFANVYDMQ